MTWFAASRIRLGGSVVLLQPDHPCAREGRLEVQDVPDVRPPPGVDALVVVTHHHEVGVFPRQELEETELSSVGVLVFVHQDEGEPAAVLVQDGLVPLQKLHGLHQEVVEIEGVVVPERLLIEGIHPGHVPGRRSKLSPFSSANSSGRDELVLRPAHVGPEDLGVPALRVDPRLLLGSLHLPEALLLIVYREGGRPPKEGGVASEHPGSQGSGRSPPTSLRAPPPGTGESAHASPRRPCW